jgi:hypothetical protein
MTTAVHQVLQPERAPEHVDDDEREADQVSLDRRESHRQAASAA